MSDLSPEFQSAAAAPAAEETIEPTTSAVIIRQVAPGLPRVELNEDGKKQLERATKAYENPNSFASRFADAR